ncbi:acyl-CoA ligase (AMP-forming), exosortase A system-associated [Paremcibacter congregatus]|uniref:acyl-CoA ligase (AMP-forming), exosortase A system-associated n=1 Tax=Paremcibacter congregatus TaxID=2043170 RepID=UPI003A8DDA3B
MHIRLSDFIKQQAKRHPNHMALKFKKEEMTYGALEDNVKAFGQALLAQGLDKNDRVACYLPKQMETVTAIFGPAHAGGVFVPVNPGLKPRQVGYILQDCNVRFLVTSGDRLMGLKMELAACADLKLIVVTGKMPAQAEVIATETGKEIISYEAFLTQGKACDLLPHTVIDTDITAILYTSGSTGMPKGVVLSHRNMIAGAESVAAYLENTNEDVILSVLPLSFDAGLSQLTTAFFVGATVVLMNFLLPRDVIRQAAKHNVTGITCVPPLWIQLADLDWPEEVIGSLRYIATTGGRMPIPVTRKLQSVLHKSDIYLMYGLTEAFRSTYLPPSEVDRIPDSIGKAIPNAEIMVVREDGTSCEVGEVGELVHRGALVGLGYWNDPEGTNERYRRAPGQPAGLPNPEIAVWSGDTVKKDADGYLYFVGRRDEMIKTSGFRTSPTEVEELIYASGLVDELAAIGVEHDQLGQAIWVIATAKTNAKLDQDAILTYCRAEMPTYMVPQRLIEWPSLPRNPNGKIDRKSIAATLKEEEL